jgi:hypothetical protein
MTLRTKKAFIAASLLLLIGACGAQEAAPLAKVKVTLFDQTGAVIVGGEVDFKSAAKTIVSHTGPDGSVVATLPGGRYSVTAIQRGFQKEEISDFEVVAPQSNELKIVLKVDPNAIVDCGPCGCGGCVPLIETTQTSPEPPTAITSEPVPVSPPPTAAKKIRSLRCLYVWKCSAVSVPVSK